MKILPPKFTEWAPENTVKKMFFEDSPPPNLGGESPPPKFGGCGFSGYRSLSGPSGPKCPRSVPESVRDTFLTLWGHSRDTFWTLRSGPRGHPVGHSLGHPPFSGTLSGTLRAPGTLRARRARETPVAGRRDRKFCHVRVFQLRTQRILKGYFNLKTCKAKITLQGQNNLRHPGKRKEHKD